MKTSLLYIYEDNIDVDLEAFSKLAPYSHSSLFILVQLKKHPIEFEPMIIDLTSIRIEKITKKVRKALIKFSIPLDLITIKVLTKKPIQKDIDYQFDSIAILDLYYRKENTKVLTELLRFIKRGNSNINSIYL